MSSPIPTQVLSQSSPIDPSSHRRRKSQFTFKQLTQTAAYSVSSPLRVIAHIDLDAFYAQVEGVRLGIDEKQPLAVQQWQGIIAINYPARAFGLSRFANIAEAKKACPELILQHVATWKEGENSWAYHPDAFNNLGTMKVSLDPYRLQSRRILALIRETLPAAPLQRIEKASVDEVFLDLSAQIHSTLIDRYPELRGPPPYDDPTERLPTPPISALNWATDALVDLDNSENEIQDPDWDDIALQIGSEIVRQVRTTIKEKLKYTCSAGIARNKMIAKLGSAYKKPNSQTVVRGRAITQFLSTFKFTKIRNLGGKLGDEIVNAFGTDTVAALLGIPLEQIKKRLGDDTGTWVFNVIRGVEHSEVNPRTQIKSMLSAKSFRPSINDFETAVRWLRIFVADIYARLVEEGITTNRRRPKTINLHHRQGAQTRSKQAPIPMGKPIDAALLLDLAKSLLAQVVVDGRAWPCANLSLSVGGFEDGPINNKGIGGFLIRGGDVKALQCATSSGVASDAEPQAKRQKFDSNADSLTSFFLQEESTSVDAEDMDFDDVPSGQPQLDTTHGHVDGDDVTWVLEQMPPQNGDCEVSLENKNPGTDGTYECATCNKRILLLQQSEHADFHFAKNLEAEEGAQQVTRTPVPPTPRPPSAVQKSGRSRHSVEGGKVEKGQRRLAFGK